MWGDGISTSGGGMRHGEKLSKTESNNPEEVQVFNVYLYDNGRNNISHTKGRNMIIEGGIIGLADRTEPRSGIDVEPGSRPHFVRGFEMRNIKFLQGRAVVLVAGSQDAIVEDIESYNTSETLIARGRSVDSETERDAVPDGYTQIFRRWKIGGYDKPATGYLFIMDNIGEKIFEDIKMVNSTAPINIQIAAGYGGTLSFDNIFMDGFRTGFEIQELKGRPNIGDVTIKNTELVNGDVEGRGRYLIKVKTDSKIHIENLKAKNTRGFGIFEASEIYLKDVDLKNNKGSSTTANGYIFRINAKKGTKVYTENVTVNGNKIPDYDFVSDKDQTVVWLDRKGEFREKL